MLGGEFCCNGANRTIDTYYGSCTVNICCIHTVSLCLTLLHALLILRLGGTIIQRVINSISGVVMWY